MPRLQGQLQCATNWQCQLLDALVVVVEVAVVEVAESQEAAAHAPSHM